ncbi:hypothetical protein ACFL3C_03785 [Patescibacteria group bacterium]
MDNLFSEKRLIFLSPAEGGPKPKPSKQETHESIEKSSLKVEKTPEALKTEVERTRESIQTLKDHIKKRTERNPALKKVLARLDQIDDEFYRLTQGGEGVKLKALQKIQTMIYKPGSELNKQRIVVAQNILEKSVGDFENGNVARLVDMALLLKSDGIPLKVGGFSVERRGHNIVLRNGKATNVFKLVIQGDNLSLNQVGISQGKRTETVLDKDKTEPYSLRGLFGKNAYKRPFYANKGTATKDVYDYSHMPKAKPKQTVAAKKAPEKQKTQAQVIGAQLTQAFKLIKEHKALNATAKKGLSTIATLLQKSDEAGQPTHLDYKGVKIALTHDGQHLQISLPKQRGKHGATSEVAVYSINDKVLANRETTKEVTTKEIIHKRWQNLEKRVSKLKPGEQVSITVKVGEKTERFDIKKTKTGLSIHVDGVLNKNLNMANMTMINTADLADYKIVTATKPKVAAKAKPAKPHKFKKGSTGDLVRQASEGVTEGPDAKWKAAMKQNLDAKVKQLSSHSKRFALAQQIIKVLRAKTPNKPKNTVYAEAGRRVANLMTRLQNTLSRVDSQTKAQTEGDINKALALLPIGNKKEGPLYAFAKDLQSTPDVKQAAPAKTVAAKPEVKFDKVALKDWPKQMQTNVATVLVQLLKHPSISKAYNAKFNSVATILMKKAPGSQYLNALKQHKAVRKLFQDLARNPAVKKYLKRYNKKALLGQIKKLALAPYPSEPKNPTAAESTRIAELKKGREKMKKWTVKVKNRDIST